MKIHNLVEDVVAKYLKEVLEMKPDICTCDQCLMDMTCYALNKLRPMYVVSSRGIIHSENQKRDNSQQDIDVMSVVMEAVNVVSQTRRHDEEHIQHHYEKQVDNTKGYCFNFPHIVGRVIDSQSFLAAEDVSVELFFSQNKQATPMMNEKWTNPLKLVPQMEGTFSFWPAPVAADKKGIQKDFQLQLELKKEGYDTIIKYFEIRLVSDVRQMEYSISDQVFHLDDIFLYQEEEENQ
ncbi:MAG: late competence development ComFB family protein [Spirochaetes bacterium]|nr:late competence development ComFB family protein [Spirochaetota bacterium]